MSDLDLTDLGRRIDEAGDRADVAELRTLIARCEATLASASPTNRVLVHYFQANAFHEAHRIRSADSGYNWSWEQDDAVGGVLALRRAIQEPAYRDLPVERQCQIRTNLANALSNVGRPVEAIEHWTSVLSELPKFAMALGNRAICLRRYAGSLYDNGHRGILLLEALTGLEAATSRAAFWDSGHHPEVASLFAQEATKIRECMDVEAVKASFDPDKWGLGRSAEEKRYRRWALNNSLFLNPLNDAASWPIAARDVLHLPDHTYKLSEEPRFVRFYDIMKSEFVAARLFLFEALNSDGSFADKGVLHYNSFDGTRYGLRLERLRAAFRAAYSIFDKIAFFINDYYHLGRNLRRINFRNVFYEQSNENQPRRLAAKFPGARNLPLRGLFSLSKDIFDPEFNEAAAPDAQFLDNLRNAAEHRFLSLHEYPPPPSTEILASVEIEGFENSTLRILKLVRAALIYLSLVVGQEERLRGECHPAKQKVSIFGVPLANR